MMTENISPGHNMFDKMCSASGTPDANIDIYRNVSNLISIGILTRVMHYLQMLANVLE